MKKIYFVFTSLILLSLSGCLKEEDDIFSSSAAERLNKAIEDNYNDLVSSENGWIMEYFPTSTTPGYNFLVKFDSNGSTTVAAKNSYTGNSYTTDESLFDVIGDMGPVLTFNTYNTIIHRFSDPSYEPYGRGLEGDYEFRFVSVEDENIFLKGKKKDLPIYLRKLDKNQDWENFFEKIDGMEDLFFGGYPPAITLEEGNVKYFIEKARTNIFSFFDKEADEDAEEELEEVLSMPFIVSLSGIRFLYPLELAGISGDVQTFVLNDEKSALVSVENPAVKIVGIESLADFFIQNQGQLRIDEESVGSEIKEAYDKVIENVYRLNPTATQVSFLIRYVSGVHQFALTYRTTQSITGGVPMEITKVNTNEVSLSLDPDQAKDNGAYFLRNIDGFRELVELIGGNYSLKADYLINPSVGLTFTDVNNTNKSFTVSY